MQDGKTGAEIATIRDKNTAELIVTMHYFKDSGDFEIVFGNKKIPRDEFDVLMNTIQNIKKELESR